MVIARTGCARHAQRAVPLSAGLSLRLSGRHVGDRDIYEIAAARRAVLSKDFSRAGVGAERVLRNRVSGRYPRVRRLRDMDAARQIRHYARVMHWGSIPDPGAIGTGRPRSRFRAQHVAQPLNPRKGYRFRDTWRVRARCLAALQYKRSLGGWDLSRAWTAEGGQPGRSGTLAALMAPDPFYKRYLSPPFGKCAHAGALHREPRRPKGSPSAVAHDELSTRHGLEYAENWRVAFATRKRVREPPGTPIGDLRGQSARHRTTPNGPSASISAATHQMTASSSGIKPERRKWRYTQHRQASSRGGSRASGAAAPATSDSRVSIVILLGA